MQMPQDMVFWYTLKNPASAQPLTQSVTVDVVVVGGGFAGLAAAQRLRAENLTVALIEQDFCGAGASGKSSGFITPDSELGFRDFTQRYGIEKANQIWQFGTSGVEYIRRNVEQHQIACDYQVQDSLFIANDSSGYQQIKAEYDAQIKNGFTPTLYDANGVASVIGSSDYQGAIRYKGTFGICAYLYCQAMRDILVSAGVQVYEKSKVIKVDSSGVYTDKHKITAKKSIVCVDRFLPELGLLEKEVYHAQTFLGITKPLTDAQLRMIFPEQLLMVWDTDFIYNYFRVVGGSRLLIGAGDLFSMLATHENHRAEHIVKKMYAYIAKKFPELSISLEYSWPGLIGISKDLIPIAGEIEKNCFVVTSAQGLPWATALGVYAAEKTMNMRAPSALDAIFSPERSYPISGCLQTMLGTKLSFGLSNMIKKMF